MGKAWPALDIHVPGCDPQMRELVLVELDDLRPTAVQESEDESRLRVFFAAAGARDAAARALAASFAHHLLVAPVDVDDEDWAARSQAALHAVIVGRIIVAPPWEADTVREPRDRSLVIINPAMGFGTGHHATTRLTLKALQRIPVGGRSVLDIGCGSGVLTIAAVRLGARTATGIDIDPDAVANANENLELNGAGTVVRFEAGDFREAAHQADIVMANVTGALLERSAAALAGSVRRGGHLIISGFMETERQPVLSAFEKLLKIEAVDQEDEWVCCTLHWGIEE